MEKRKRKEYEDNRREKGIRRREREGDRKVGRRERRDTERGSKRIES